MEHIGYQRRRIVHILRIVSADGQFIELIGNRRQPLS